MGAGSAEGGPCPSRRGSRATVQGPTEAALRSFNSWLTCQGDDKGMLTKLANVAAGEMKISGIDFPKPLLNAGGTTNWFSLPEQAYPFHHPQDYRHSNN